MWWDHGAKYMTLQQRNVRIHKKTTLRTNETACYTDYIQYIEHMQTFRIVQISRDSIIFDLITQESAQVFVIASGGYFIK